MVDTGMNRLGVTAEEARSALADGLAVDTLMSHLACADEPQHPLNQQQLQRFQALRGALRAKRYSLANSAGICLGSDYAFDLTRPGLALYGGVPVADDIAQQKAIRPIVFVEARLVQIRTVPAGDGVGYGATWVAPSERRVGILNIGYADGYLRALGSHGRVEYAEQSFPVVGRVSMDLIAVDLSDAAPAPAEGDWMAVDYRLPELAAESGLSQYELLTNLGTRFERRWT
jgi:alanine racemase